VTLTKYNRNKQRITKKVLRLQQRDFPYQSFRFIVEINGVLAGGFSEVSGLQAETQVEVIEEGGVNDYVHRFPKKTLYPNLVLKHGMADSAALYQWHKDVANGKITRASGSIIMLDANANPVARWNFNRAYPVKWVGPELKAESNAVAVEAIELVHEGLERGN
jgi:phage tail-like protein